MKKIIMAVLVLGLGLVASPVRAVNVNNFYYSDFTGDYYLTKADDGTSRLRVVESVTAEFPEYPQNKGICRQIPFTNQDGANVTLPELTYSDLTLTRNGAVEPIYSIDRDGDFYNVCTGTDEYVLGTQKYTFEYEFINVVTEFVRDGGGYYQELYWDTNGNGSQQRFDKVTARLHFEDVADWTGDSWCYVGKNGTNDQTRCTITELDDGVQFETLGLAPSENLTFDVELKADAFVVPEPTFNYNYVWMTIVLCLICIAWILWRVMKYGNTHDKIYYYKNLFVAPQYQPHAKYSLPEMAEVYLGKKKDVKVAMLLDLVVKHKIEFKRGERKKQWIIVVKDLTGVGEEYIDLLALLNEGYKPENGGEIELKRRSATTRSVKMRKEMEQEILAGLKRDELVEPKYHLGQSNGRGVANVVFSSLVMVPIVVVLAIFFINMLSESTTLLGSYGEVMVFKTGFYITALMILTVTVVVTIALSEMTMKYAGYTMMGIRMSRYMDGLRLYIDMAEADRLKMLQSVKGADTSADGIVKLYEKLLPYAAVFGLEQSWLKEMKQYCEVNEIEEPNYLLTGITIAELSRTMHNAASYATTSSTMYSSGGGSSSSFSGGGGGGFSGGGGGGGGFSGR